MTVTFGLILGFIIWVLVRYGVPGLFTVNQNERAVKTSFGRAVRMGELTTLDDPVSEPLNPDERAPMGIGIWYEMFVSDPIAYLFRNADPRGSLAANVSNSTVRCLSNMPLGEMLVNRHPMSNTVRAEVSPQSHDWGYRLGSVYIRKVHFRDLGRIKQIESKVVNRLRQVTSAIRQEGANQVNIITSTAEREAAVEFAKAAAIRPEIVGATLERISREPDLAAGMFEILESQQIIEGEARITLLPRSDNLLGRLLAAAARNDSVPRS